MLYLLWFVNIFLALDYIQLEREIWYVFGSILSSYMNPFLRSKRKPPGFKTSNDSYCLNRIERQILKEVIFPIPAKYMLMEQVVHIYPSYYFLWDLHLLSDTYQLGIIIQRKVDKIKRWYVCKYTRTKFD